MAIGMGALYMVGLERRCAAILIRFMRTVGLAAGGVCGLGPCLVVDGTMTGAVQ